jgi:hypothetical protein
MSAFYEDYTLIYSPLQLNFLLDKPIFVILKFYKNEESNIQCKLLH